MPPSGRKSSLASSRNGPKKYIPYRADDFQHGKKTGMIVETVDHTDEFEPFDKVIGQADKHTPYRVQNGRKRRVTKTPVAVENNFDDDEYGEAPMELEDSMYTHLSPPRVLCALTHQNRHSAGTVGLFRAYTHESYHFEREPRRLVYSARYAVI